MYLSYLDSEQYKDIWDRFILAEKGQYWQSWQWSQAEKKCGKEAFYLAVFEKDESGRDFFCAACAVYLQKLALGKNILTIYRGPVMNLLSQDLYPAIEILFNEISKIASEKKAIFLRIDPPVLSSQANYLGAYFSTLGSKVAGSPNRLTSRSRCRINITQQESEIISSAPTRFAYNLRIAKSRFEIIQSNAAKEMQVFLALLKENDAVKKRWNIFCEYLNQAPAVIPIKSINSEEENRGPIFPIKIFLAEEKEEAIAAIIIMYFGDIAALVYEKNNLKNDQMALYLLHLQAMLDAKSSGINIYEVSREKSAIADDLGGKLEFLSDSYDIVYDRFWHRMLKKTKIA